MRRTAATVLLGLGAGLFGGLFGVGGGLVMVPGLVLLLDLPQHRAHATSVAAIVAAATAAVLPLALEGEVRWDATLLILAGAIAGAALGARLIARIPAVWLAGSFVVVILAAAIRMATSGSGDPATVAAASIDLPSGAGLVLVGLAAGALAAMLGIGGGIVYVPALVTLFGFAQHQAQATSLAVMVPTTLVAALVHSRAGRVDWPKALALGIGGVTGGLIGALSALQIDALLLRRLFAGILVLVALRMLVRAARLNRARASGSSPG